MKNDALQMAGFLLEVSFFWLSGWSIAQGNLIGVALLVVGFLLALYVGGLIENKAIEKYAR